MLSHYKFSCNSSWTAGGFRGQHSVHPQTQWKADIGLTRTARTTVKQEHSLPLFHRDYSNTNCMVTDMSFPGLWWLISAPNMSDWQESQLPTSKPTGPVWVPGCTAVTENVQEIIFYHLCSAQRGQFGHSNQTVANSWAELYAWSYHSCFELPFHQLFHQNTELIISVKSQNQNNTVLIVDNFL